MALYEFKDTSFSRGHRIQNIEESFNKGMQYSEVPLEEGYAKVLCNFDIKDSGKLLKPRPGLRTTDIYANAGSVVLNAPLYPIVGNGSFHRGDIVYYNGYTYGEETIDAGLYQAVDDFTVDIVRDTTTIVKSEAVGSDWFSVAYPADQAQYPTPSAVTCNGIALDPADYTVTLRTPLAQVYLVVTIPKTTDLPWTTDGKAEITVHMAAFDHEHWELVSTDSMQYNKDMVNIVTAREQSLTNTAQVLLSIPTPAGNMYTACVTGYSDQVPEEYVQTVEFSQRTEKRVYKTYEEVDTHPYQIELYNGIKYVAPDNAEMHGMPLDNINNIARPVGTWAWNNNFYALDDKSKQVVYTEYNGSRYGFNTLQPKYITPAEATQYGYNMLRSNPYDFSNETIADGNPLSVTGLLPYDSEGKLCMAPVANQQLEFRAYWRAPFAAHYNVLWEWRVASESNWNTISESQFAAYAEPITCSFSPPTKNIIIRVTVTPEGGTNPDAVLAVGFSFDKDSYGATANAEAKAYDLFTARGMCYWKQRLILWGVDPDRTILFVSDVNDPSYFPYPNNVDTFEEPIKYCVPFRDQLLVFTATQVWLLAMEQDGMSWTKQLIQSNLRINDWDLELIQVVKNMVFFKSGNYFYMIVPKTSALITSNTTTDLGVAAISKPMVEFFDHFEDNMLDLVNFLYDTKYHPRYRGLGKNGFTLVAYQDYLDYEDVHVVYTFRGDASVYEPEFINVELLYNTVNRSWRVYCVGSTSIPAVYTADSTQRGKMCYLSWQNYGSPVPPTPSESGVIETTFVSRWYLSDRIQMKTMFDTYVTESVQPIIQILHWDPVEVADLYLPAVIPVADSFYAHGDLSGPYYMWKSQFNEEHIFTNRQHINTGYREHDTNFKKRYRELQFTLNNKAKERLNFYTDFFIDGEQRKNSRIYEVVHDPTRQNDLTVEEILGTPESTVDITRLNTWTLDVDRFPDPTFCKIRFPVSGKGYVPKLIIQNRDEKPYELLNISWVYRPLYSR